MGSDCIMYQFLIIAYLFTFRVFRNGNAGVLA